MPPTLHIPPILIPKAKAPFSAPLLQIGELDSCAADHLRKCHTETGLQVDDATCTKHLTYRFGKLLLRIFIDQSALLGTLHPDNKVSWYGIPFALDSPFYETSPSPIRGTEKRQVHFKIDGLKLRLNGPEDLQAIWQTTLFATMKEWAQTLGPVPDYGSPQMAKLVSPSYPFRNQRKKLHAEMEAFFHAAVLTTGLVGKNTSLVIWGHKPSLTGWQEAYVEIWEDGQDSEETLIISAMHAIKSLLSHPDLPYPRSALIQEATEQSPLFHLTPGNPSNHDVLQAHALVAKTLTKPALHEENLSHVS